MVKKDLWHLFPEKYFMSITMIFGSMIAGKVFSLPVPGYSEGKLHFALIGYIKINHKS